jgi:DNA topoisomerase VI subunit B
MRNLTPDGNSNDDLERLMFSFSRSREYFDANELQTMTGQPQGRFPEVVFKELWDNALDIAEKAKTPPRVGIRLEHRGKRLLLSISDNGTGLEPDTVTKLLDFSTRTSDKAAYRSPTRGALGNAFKTILGIPFALGIHAPVVIRSRGVKHVIRCRIDPANEVEVDHETSPIDPRPGTTIALALPARACRSTPFLQWAQAFAIFNPHATVRIRETNRPPQQGTAQAAEVRKMYHSVVAFPEKWTKFLPTDHTSPWWYDSNALARLVFAHLAAPAQAGEVGPSLRDFVRQFKGVTRTAHAKAVCDKLPHIKRLADFRQHEGDIGVLLRAMQKATQTPPCPSVLGVIGKDPIHERLHRWFGVRRYWYKKTEVLVHGVPYLIEVAVAQTRRKGRLFHGVNFSPTFGDPLAGTQLSCQPRSGGEYLSGHGLEGFLDRLYVLSRGGGSLKAAAFFHLSCPALQFTDKGKTHLQIPPEVARAVGEAFWAVGKELYREGERLRKDIAAAMRQERQRLRSEAKQQKPPSLKEMCYAVLREAYDHETDHDRTRTTPRFLFYTTRKLVEQKFGFEIAPKQYSTFSQKILPTYRREVEPLPKVYYEPRGTLHEPHTGKDIPIGDVTVEEYHFPDYLYDKILFVEKEGSVWAILEDAGIAERYDLCVVTGKGYATEAVRKLLQKADRDRHYQLFVFHDADPDGYNIARTLQEETDRMPGFSLEVIDLGLGLEEAIGLGFEVEEFTRKKPLPKGLVLNEVERKAFEGRPVSKKVWISQRIEVNQLGAAGMAAHIEQSLIACGVRGKVVPPADYLRQQFRKEVEEQIGERVRESYEEMIAAETRKRLEAITPGIEDCEPELEAMVRSYLETNPTHRWVNAIEDCAEQVVEDLDNPSDPAI